MSAVTPAFCTCGRLPVIRRRGSSWVLACPNTACEVRPAEGPSKDGAVVNWNDTLREYARTRTDKPREIVRPEDLFVKT